MRQSCVPSCPRKRKRSSASTLKGDTLRKYFPASYTPKRMEETIIKLLEQWQKQQKRRVRLSAN